jgi:hypothetical protein
MSSTKLRASLQQLQQQRRSLLRRLTSDQELAVGTVSVVERKCGNPACHCAKGTGHPQTLFLFKDDEGQRRCKLIRRADEKQLLRAGALYRQFRKDLRQLTTINKREKQILMALVKARTIHYT